MDPKPSAPQTPANFRFKKQDPNSAQITPRSPAVGIGELRNENAKLRDENTRLRKRVTQFTEQSEKIKVLERDNGKLQDEIATLKVTVDEQDGDVYTANIKVSEAKKDAEEQARQLEQKSEELAALVKAAQELAEAEKVTRAGFESDNKKIRAELAASNGRASELTKLLELANEQLKEKNDDDAKKQAHIESLINQNSALSQMLEIASKTPVASVSQSSAVPSESASAGLVVDVEVQRGVDNALKRKSGEHEQQALRS